MAGRIRPAAGFMIVPAKSGRDRGARHTQGHDKLTQGVVPPRRPRDARPRYWLAPRMLPATPPPTAPIAAPVQALPPAIAAMPAPAPAPIAAPLIVPCCCGVMLVHAARAARAAMARIV